MWKEIVCILALSGCVWIIEGLKCFTCLDTSAGEPCKNDYKGLVNARQDNGSEYYIKECHDGINYGLVAQDFCVIEVYYGAAGALASFMRDCSDGKTFSFSTKDPNNTHPKLRQIAGDNFTTCVYQAGTHICVTLCDDGDFCNGPLPPEDTCNDTDDNATCGAGGLFMGSGPFGPTVDRVLGRGYLVPLLVAILSVGIFG